LHGFLRIYGPGGLEFCLEGGQLTREGVCPLSLLIKCSLLLDLVHCGRRSERIELGSGNKRPWIYGNFAVLTAFDWCNERRGSRIAFTV
jgi:hypothetical protein